MGARTNVALSGAVEQQQFLTFMLGGEMLAVGILHIKEIIEYAGVTTVPMMPACIRGVINLRGAVVPVMDLAARFGKPASEVTKRTCIVIVELGEPGERQDMGIVVDTVNAVLEIAAADIEPAPAFGARIRTDFIAGMGKVNGKFVILLDVEQVLSDMDIGALTQINEAGAALPAPALSQHP
ncbi:chemotaxis protein CheW [Massilia sp. DWR3-1-1]|uniref:chemotaxis protein CheW n=1 Tax=Massilia sp. DWR3-1-1 TaxID=2804559 RepID=UPI003CE79410